MCALTAELLTPATQATPDPGFFCSRATGYEPRAVFPHHEVQYNIALCIKELQDEEQSTRLLSLQKEFKGGPCIGIQLDMWTDTNTHVAYGGVNCVTVIEPMVMTAPSTGVAKPQQLYAQSEVLDFDVFPLTEHTGENIKQWLVKLLERKKIAHSAISGVTPDGAADGQCGLAAIDTLAEKVDTCTEHRLQRALLFAIGLAGSQCKNPESKAIIKQHNRIAQLKNQCRAVSDGIRNLQVEEGIPSSSVLTTVDTSTTRWGNQFRQIDRNNTLRPVIDPVVDAYKRENKHKKDAIVEDDDTDPTSRVGKAVPAAQIGLSTEQWDKSLELEAFLDHPFKIKDSIEYKGYCTGAQALYLINDLRKGCDSDKSLEVKLHPANIKLESRKRLQEIREASDLHELVSKGRSILVEELSSRFFGERPSNARLVQIWMSKQRPADKWLPPEWHVLAKGLYLRMLRLAAAIAHVGARLSPPKKKQKSKASSSLVRNLSSDDEEPAATADGESDAVVEEAERWKNLDKATIREFRDAEGLVNEFALVYKVRHMFPMHYVLFKQVSSHLAHEANSEQLFSRSGELSDDNGKMDPARLAIWTSIGVNRSVFEPSWKQILERYLLKFSAGSKKVHTDDLGLLDPDGGVDATNDGGYYARWGAPAPQNLGLHAGTHLG